MREAPWGARGGRPPHPTSLLQAPRQQGAAAARETPDQQCWQEKEAHRGEENPFSSVRLTLKCILSSFCFLFVNAQILSLFLMKINIE